MIDFASLSELVSHPLEHPVPAIGDVVSLDYPDAPGSVAVHVETSADGMVRLTVTASVGEAARSVESAQAALVRSTGGDPADSAAVERARKLIGPMDFAQGVVSFARQRLLSLAMMRTGILPFLAPHFMDGAAPEPGKPFAFDVQFLLRPQAELTSYGPVEVEVPVLAEVTEEEVDQAIEAVMGGVISFAQIPEEARASFDRLRDQAREQVRLEHEATRLRQLMDLCTDELVARLAEQPPLRYVELLRNQMANQFAANMEQSGTSWAEYIARPDYDEEAFKRAMTQDAIRSLTRGLALDAMAAHEGITLDVDDIVAALGPVARGNEAVAAQAMLDSGQLPQLCEVARRGKTAEFVARRVMAAQ